MNNFAAQDSARADERGKTGQDAASYIALPHTLGFAEEVTDERERRDLILMRLKSGGAVGVFADEAEMVIPQRRATPLPGAPAAICGVVSVRGRMYTLVDLDLLFEEFVAHKKPRAARANKTAPVNQPDDDLMIVALRGDEQLALLVGRVERIVEVPTDSIVTMSRHASFLRGVTEHEKQLISVLDPSKIFLHVAPVGENLEAS